jgi:hypothetical protein
MDLPPHPHPALPNTGNPNLDQKYRQEQEKLIAKQNQEHQKLQQQQEKEHQRLAQQKADEASKQADRAEAPATDAAIGAKTRTAADVAGQTAASKPESVQASELKALIVHRKRTGAAHSLRGECPVGIELSFDVATVRSVDTTIAVDTDFRAACETEALVPRDHDRRRRRLRKHSDEGR